MLADSISTISTNIRSPDKTEIKGTDQDQIRTRTIPDQDQTRMRILGGSKWIFLSDPTPFAFPTHQAFIFIQR